MESIAQADLPNPRYEPKLFSIVNAFPKHHYSKTCCRHRNENCRFHFGKFFTKHKITAEEKNKQIVNNYFTVGLMAWKANIDMQQIFNH